MGSLSRWSLKSKVPRVVTKLSTFNGRRKTFIVMPRAHQCSEYVCTRGMCAAILLYAGLVSISLAKLMLEACTLQIISTVQL